jgi:hypothetical protein
VPGSGRAWQGLDGIINASWPLPLLKVKVRCEKSDGAVISWEEPISEDDIRAIEDDIDAYLRDAGLPPRPRGNRWFLRLPESLDMAGVDDAASRVVMALHGQFGNPRSLAPAVEQAITDLYVREQENTPRTRG